MALRRRGQLLFNGGKRSHWIIGCRDGATDNEIVGTGSNRFRRLHMATLVASRNAGRTHTGRYLQEIRRYRLGDPVEVRCGANDAIKTRVVAQPGQALYLLIQRPGNTRVRQVFRRQTCKNRYGDKQRCTVTIPNGPTGCLQHTPTAGSVNVEHPHTKIDSSTTSAVYGVRNVMKFKIKKDFKTTLV